MKMVAVVEYCSRVQECDATGDATCNDAGYKKILCKMVQPIDK